MIPILGLILGLFIGLLAPFDIPSSYSVYVGMAILAALDAIFGGTVASLRGVFDLKLFVSGLLTGLVLALALAFIGEQLGVPLYYGAIFAYGYRIFKNAGALRRLLIKRGSGRGRERLE